jgi:hypothetical protein
VLSADSRDGSTTFVGGDGRVQADGSLAAALSVLAEVAPASMPYGELARRVGVGAEDALPIDLKDLWLAGTGIDLHAREPTLCPVASRAPEACPVARWHAAHGGPITNLWHQEVVLPEAVVRVLLSLLDGAANHEELARRIAAELPALSGTDAASVVTAGLALLGQSALLVR